MGTEAGSITRRTDNALLGLQEEFRAFFCREDFSRQLAALEKTGARSDRASKMRKLYDMLDACGIACERGRELPYYERLVREAHLPAAADMEGIMLRALYSRYREYPTPEAYMKRIVDRLENPADGWKNDTLRLRIAKQFIRYGGFLKDAGYGGKNAVGAYVRGKIGHKPTVEEVLSNLDDAVFLCLERADKEQKKPEGKYGLLKAADDLAAGKFRSGGATKKNLYLFAMVYAMAYYRPDAVHAAGYEEERDIEANLFRDYYANNLTRFLSAPYRGREREYEPDPSGQGINPRNFAEVICLYYLCSSYSPQEKIRRSFGMIRRLQEQGFKAGRPPLAAGQGTLHYRSLLEAGGGDMPDVTALFLLPEEEFERFVQENYCCDTFNGCYAVSGRVSDGRTGVFMLETQQDSARRELAALLSEQKHLGLAPEDCRYGLWFTDAEALRRQMEQSGPADADKAGQEEFRTLLLHIDRFLRAPAAEESPITRTALLAAFYYVYNARHEDDGEERWKSFAEVFDNFKKDIDPILARAYYQPLCARNIFDVLLVFSSYAYLNL